MKNPGNPNNTQTNKKRVWKIRLLIFFVLFIVLEIILRCFGMKPGTLIDELQMEDSPVYEPRFTSDEKGINHLVPEAKNLMLGTIINKQGFRGDFDYTAQTIDSIRKATNKKIIMIIGDSFVEGCCADTVTNSFPDLINKDPRYCVLNFGVAGTDPVQYKLLAEKYVKQLKPDKVVIAFYFGNDIFAFERTPTPGTPLTFPFKNNKWLFSVTDNSVSLKEDLILKTPAEAYQFYINHYTLFGNNRNWFEKFISHSICFSKLYLAIEHKINQMKWQKKQQEAHPGKIYEPAEVITNRLLAQLKASCDSARVPVLFAGIPCPLEASKGAGLKEKYALIFKELEWNVPNDLVLDDYDGSGVGNHFNNNGHKKYAAFLKKLLSEQK